MVEEGKEQQEKQIEQEDIQGYISKEIFPVCDKDNKKIFKRVPYEKRKHWLQRWNPTNIPEDINVQLALNTLSYCLSYTHQVCYYILYNLLLLLLFISFFIYSHTIDMYLEAIPDVVKKLMMLNRHLEHTVHYFKKIVIQIDIIH